MDLHWHDWGGYHQAIHRPALVAYNTTHVPIELELTRTSKERLRATLFQHAVWVAGGATGGVIYVCTHQHWTERIADAGAAVGLYLSSGALRIEFLDTLKNHAAVRGEEVRAQAAATRMAGAA